MKKAYFVAMFRLLVAARGVTRLGMLFLMVYAVMFWHPRESKATNKPIAIMKTPAANLSLPNNTVTSVPGVYCNVTVWNNTATPVYVGGPQIGSPPVTTAGVTVSVAAGMPICTNTAVCRDSLSSINVNTGGVALLQNSGGAISVRVMLGDGCGS